MSVDILLSTYNGEQFLSDQLESILNQSYKDFKIIIRDDNSSDNTIKIILDYVEKYNDKILFVSDGTNLGSTQSFFELLKLSSSDLVMFCDQDDVWKTNKIEVMVDYYKFLVLQNEKKPILIHSGVDVTDERLNLLPDLTHKFNSVKCGMEKSFVWQIFQNDVTGCTVLINSEMRNLFSKINIEYGNIIQHDWILAQVAYLNNSKFYLQEKTIQYRQHSKNVLGVRKMTIVQILRYKIKKGLFYPYYEHIGVLLKLLPNLENRYEKELIEFSNLKNKNKIYRIFWHLKHKFLRDGNLIYKIYQLIIC